MKKVIVGLMIIVLMLLGISTISMANNVELTSNASTSNTIVTNKEEKNIIGEVSKLKEKAQTELEDYIERYGSEAYGLTAYILKKVQIYSIPFCFLGVAISAIYQYVLGIRKLDTRDKGFYALVGFVTLFVICQVLPLVFVIVIKGWRG